MLTSLAQAVLALAIAHAPPGRSPYSFEALPSCGKDAHHPTCVLRPACADPSPLCARPRWNAARQAWVRVESRDTAVRRYARIATVLADTAEHMKECKSGAPACQDARWPGSTRSLALAALTVALYESGLREDVQSGYPPLGRGPAGEVCLMQIAPEEAVKNAPWLSDDERARLSADPHARERFARTLLGESNQALKRCFEIGMRMLARARRSCAGVGTSWAYGMFSMYGSGGRCSLPGVADRRAKTFHHLLEEHASLDVDTRKILGALLRARVTS
jgi:hypothetical protein